MMSVAAKMAVSMTKDWPNAFLCFITYSPFSFAAAILEQSARACQYQSGRRQPEFPARLRVRPALFSPDVCPNVRVSRATHRAPPSSHPAVSPDRAAWRQPTHARDGKAGGHGRALAGVGP